MCDTIPENTTPEQPLKYCPKCEQSYPATLEYFHSDKSTLSGLYGLCKRCKNKPPKVNDVPEGYKRCRDCKQIKPATLEHFHPYPRNIGGFRHDCKDCRSKQNKERREQPHFKEAESLRGKKYYRENKEHVQQREKNYRETHKEARKAKDERYRKTPNGKASQHGRSNRRRARKKSVLGTHTVHDIQDQYKRQKGKCYYCKKKLGDKYHVDHTFPLSRVAGTDIPANDISYLVLACPTCNQSKGNKFPWEWAEGGRLF